MESCEKCEYTSTCKGNLKKHVDSMHNGKIYPCSKCQYKAKNKSNLNKHVKTQHNSSDFEAPSNVILSSTLMNEGPIQDNHGEDGADDELDDVVCLDNSPPKKSKKRKRSKIGSTRDTEVKNYFEKSGDESDSDEEPTNKKKQERNQLISQSVISSDSSDSDEPSKKRKAEEEKCSENGCDFKSGNKEEMTFHVKNTHGFKPRDGKWNCGNCQFTCASKWEMDFHCRGKGHKMLKEDKFFRNGKKNINNKKQKY